MPGHNKQFDIVLLGPYGSGKTTQAQHLARAFGYVHFDAGSALRNFIKQGTDEAENLKAIMERGELVPDHWTVDFFREAIETSPGIMFVIDGTPRSTVQLDLFNTAEKELDRDFIPILIEISDAESLKRQVERKVCAACKKPILPNATKCSNCASTEFTTRSDHDPEIAKHRISIYHEQTDPVIQSYQDRGILYTVNGEQEIDKIASEIEKIVSIKLHTN